LDQQFVLGGHGRFLYIMEVPASHDRMPEHAGSQTSHAAEQRWLLGSAPNSFQATFCSASCGTEIGFDSRVELMLSTAPPSAFASWSASLAPSGIATAIATTVLNILWTGLHH
jgi:hypothetical protein